MTADFNADLRWSQSQATDPMWGEVYRTAFPSIASMSYVGDCPQQRDGVDRVIVTANGHVYRIDEKCVRKDYPDFFLEFWSKAPMNGRPGVPGWVAKDLACDFIAYAFIPTRRCYLLPFPSLRRAWELFGSGWRQKYRERLVPNRTYHTAGVPVPVPVVLDAIRDALLVTWGAEPAKGNGSGGAAPAQAELDDFERAWPKAPLPTPRPPPDDELSPFCD